MNIIVVLLMLLVGLRSSFGVTVDEDPAVQPAPIAAAAEPATSTEPFPDDLGPLRGDRAIEQRFLTRYPLPACDFVDSGPSMDPGPGSYDCLQEAVDAGDGAELIIASILPGGDQAYVYYRTNPDGPLEIFVDLRADGSGRDWDYQRCRPSENIAEETCA